LCAKGAVTGPQPHYKAKRRPSDNSHESLHRRLGAASHQCHLIEARQALPVFQRFYRTMKKPSGKADLGIYGYSVVVSG